MESRDSDLEENFEVGISCNVISLDWRKDKYVVGLNSRQLLVVMIHRVKYIESISSRASVGQSGNITELLKHSY